MPRHKLLLLRVDVEAAKRRRTCHHDGRHVIDKGELSLVVREGQFGRLVYCRKCALHMVELAAVALADVESRLRDSRE